MDKSIRFLSLIIIVFTTVFFINGIHKSDTNTEPKTNTHENYKINALKLPENLNFAGERVPLEIQVKTKMPKKTNKPNEQNTTNKDRGNTKKSRVSWLSRHSRSTNIFISAGDGGSQKNRSTKFNSENRSA
jgi:hypothetical protein